MPPDVVSPGVALALTLLALTALWLLTWPRWKVFEQLEVKRYPHEEMFRCTYRRWPWSRPTERLLVQERKEPDYYFWQDGDGSPMWRPNPLDEWRGSERRRANLEGAPDAETGP